MAPPNDSSDRGIIDDLAQRFHRLKLKLRRNSSPGSRPSLSNQPSPQASPPQHLSRPSSRPPVRPVPYDNGGSNRPPRPPMVMPIPVHYQVPPTLSDLHAASSPPITVFHPSQSTPTFLYGSSSSTTPSSVPPIMVPQPIPAVARPTLGGLAAPLPPPSLQSGHHHRASSAPPTPTTSGTENSGSEYQCSGITKAGKRCTRMVKAAHPLMMQTSVSAGEIERYCHQHIKDVLGPSGCYVGGDGSKWVEFSDWIPSYLDDETRVNLRTEMEKPVSASDKPGYIYAYEIRNPKTPKEVHIKVGRAVNLVKRLDQWSKQCGSKEVILRGWWPGRVVDNDDTGPSLLRGRVEAGEKGKHCHRLERLIHLELSDLVVNKAYQRPEFLQKRPNSDHVPPALPHAPRSGNKLQREECPDCGQVHKEIFTFTRMESGKLKNKEWDMIVHPVIEKWGKFVEQYL